MAVRIRYEKYEDPIGQHNMVSVRNFNSNKYTKDIDNDAMYIVYLDTKYVTYTIRNMLTMKEYTGGKDVNNLHVLKRNVKAHLEKLGVSFEDEIRDNSSRVKGVNCGYATEK